MRNAVRADDGDDGDDDGVKSSKIGFLPWMIRYACPIRSRTPTPTLRVGVVRSSC